MNVRYANTFFQRLKGMLFDGKKGMSEYVVIEPCNDIHTWWVRWPIDVAFVDCFGVVLMARTNVHPFRRLKCKKAYAVVERKSTGDGWFSLGDCIPWAARDRKDGWM